MENGLHPFFSFDSYSHSESTVEFPEKNSEKRASHIFERRAFAGITPQAMSDLTAKESNNLFKHLEKKDLKEEYKQNYSKKKHVINKSYRRSISLSSGIQIISNDSIIKDSDTKKMMTSSDSNPRTQKLCLSAREILQPITLSDNNGYKRPPLKNLDDLKLLESKQSSFNKEIRKNLKKYIENNDDNIPPIPLASALNERAQKLFDAEVCKKTKETLKLKRTTSYNLVKTRRTRAENALRQVQKSMGLVEEIIQRFKFLQNSIYKELTVRREKKPTARCYKTNWINNFFKSLDNLICTYEYRAYDKNPLKSFTHTFSNQITDPKMLEIILLCMRVSNQKFDEIMQQINWWADDQNLLSLADRICIIDDNKIKEKLDFSTDNIPLQQHEWYESGQTPYPISKLTTTEIIRCLIPDTVVLYDEITVNDKIIQLRNCNGTNKTRQINFFTSLLYAIYSSGFDRNISENQAKNQAEVLISLDYICKIIKEDLTKVNIPRESIHPWESIQKKLVDFPAIPFSAFKYHYDPILHENGLEDFLIELTIPCINVLKLCTNSCWLRGDECIRYLFTKMFKPYGENNHTTLFQTSQENGIYCHIHILNPHDYSVTQTKFYGTHLYQDELSSDGKSANFAKTTFKWTVTPFIDNETGFTSWQGLLKIPNVEIDSNTPIETKREFLKILNNPNVVDYVVNSLDGKPKIITTFG